MDNSQFLKETQSIHMWIDCVQVSQSYTHNFLFNNLYIVCDSRSSYFFARNSSHLIINKRMIIIAFKFLIPHEYFLAGFAIVHQIGAN